jgi:hypothetical protein
MALTGAALQECLRAVGTFLAKRRPGEEHRAKMDYQAHIHGSTGHHRGSSSLEEQGN